jgi:hypothetical protein
LGGALEHGRRLGIGGGERPCDDVENSREMHGRGVRGLYPPPVQGRRPGRSIWTDDATRSGGRRSRRSRSWLANQQRADATGAARGQMTVVPRRVLGA